MQILKSRSLSSEKGYMDIFIEGDNHTKLSWCQGSTIFNNSNERNAS